MYWGLVWLLGLIPPLLLSYYEGWDGAVAALAVGMVALTGAEVVGRLLMEGTLAWQYYATPTIVLVFVSLGLGLITEALRQGGGPFGAAGRQPERRAELRRAIDRGELELQYQPMVSLKTRRVVGAEALVRWRHPQHGLVAPGRFLAFAETTGLAIPLGKWVTEQALDQLPNWKRRFRSGASFTLGLNLTAGEARSAEFRAHLRNSLEQREMDPGSIQLEVTEEVFQEGRQAISELRSLGVRIALDDFGAGPTSMGLLREGAVEGVKLDRAITAGLVAQDGDESTRPIAESILSVARSVGLTVTAEGVESGEQLQVVEALGCDRAQGHYFAEPFPVSSLRSELETGF